jgi:predicted esterase
MLAACTDRPPPAVSTDAPNRESAVDLRTAACVGPHDARSFAIYLHGVDGLTPSQQELANRGVLAALAESMSIRIAFPRATMACPSQAGSLCWGWRFDEPEVAAATSIARTAARSCFGAKASTVIGFSNGGYLLTTLIRTCSLATYLPEASRVITVGAGMMTGRLEAGPESLAGCGELTMLVGNEDEYNFDPTGKLLEALRAKSASVRELRFNGGHLIDKAALAAALAAP